jgi:cytochrome c oxidase subunit 4
MEHDQPQYIGHTKTYVFVWLALLALTGITITVAGMHLGAFSMFASLLIASLKASLVLWFFMHLKYEEKLFKLMFLIPIATLTVVIGLTFLDIWYR